MALYVIMYQFPGDNVWTAYELRARSEDEVWKHLERQGKPNHPYKVFKAECIRVCEVRGHNLIIDE